MNLWSTPRYGMVRSCRVLTDRSKRDPQTQMRFEKDTDRVLNPAGEWMMAGGCTRRQDT
jgi:hypothetical protein